ncbi:MAG: tetratricopeptide repeat protein [Chloroflexota bacterium]|nr:tetratricopeptide repeat protein [Chloroflexota bacterium]
MADSVAFGTLLKQRRKAQDLTQAELADRVGCAASTIRMIEAGERRASRQLVALLADRLGVAPEARAAFIQAARAVVLPDPARSAQDLPTYLTPLLGRAGEIAALTARLRTTATQGRARLLTLTGPAGVGKTRLAVAVAADVQRQFADGVCFVALAAVQDAALALAIIAAALGLREQRAPPGGDLLAALQRYLRGKELLLILDNMEQILSAGAGLAALLGSCPSVQALVTSREPLHVGGERVFPVPPLTLPDLENLPPPAALSAYSAVALFVERAQGAVGTFALNAANARAIATICARMDGLPLAIELVAARSALFAPQVLLAKLDAARGAAVFRLLGDGARDLPARQRTLQAALGWSYDLLRPAEQTLLRWLAVFVGGGTLPAIDAVCAAGGASGGDTLAGVASLLDKSLLQRASAAEGTEEPRFQLLETVREYALAQLETQGPAEVAAVQRRHAAYFLALAEEAEPQILGDAQRVWFGRLERDHNNIQAALRWLLEHGEAEGAARLAGAMGYFWNRHSHPEVMHWFLLVLEQRQSISPPARSKVLGAACTLALGLGDLPQAQAFAEENLAVARSLGDTLSIIRALHHLGSVAVQSGNLTQAQVPLGESLRLARAVGDALAESQAANYLGELARALGDYPQAQTLYESSLRLTQETGTNWGIAVNLHNLGKVALEMSQPVAAADRLWASLRLFQEIGSRSGIAYCLVGLGEVALRLDAPARGVTIVSAADALLNELGLVLERVEYAGRDAALDQARTQLDPAGFAAAWAVGRHLSLDQAIAAAQEGCAA